MYLALKGKLSLGPTIAQYVGGSHIHTSYLWSPAANSIFQFVKHLLGHSTGNLRHYRLPVSCLLTRAELACIVKKQ